MKLRSLIQLIVLLNLFGNTLYSKNTISIGVVSSYNNSNINFYNNFFLKILEQIQFQIIIFPF